MSLREGERAVDKEAHIGGVGRDEPGGRGSSVAGLSAFRTDGRGGCSFGVGSAVIPAAGIVLGANYYPGDHSVIVGRGVRCFLAAFRRDDAWSGIGRDCSELLWAA